MNIKKIDNITNFYTMKKVLIITHLNESINAIHTHYSGIKGFLLAKGLLNNNYSIFILSNDKDITLYDNYYYINHSLLTSNILSEFKYVFFCLHNTEIIIPLYKKTDIFNNIQKAKLNNNNLKIINKTCQYPIVIDGLGINSYDFFDNIFVQTNAIKIPRAIVNYIGYKIDSSISLNILNSYCKKNKIISKINYSEMTFDISSNKIISIEPHNYIINKYTINIVYLGRLMGCNGFDILYLIKLMKQLGPKYMLYIIPGSFILPTDYPCKKKSPKRPHQYIELKNYIENYKLEYNNNNIGQYYKENYIAEESDNTECNIIVLPQFKYGEHFKFIEKMDIGFGFSCNKFSNNKVPEGSAKLFDYMCCKLRIVFEDGWDNTKYIKQYNFGECLPINSKVSDAIKSINQVMKLQKNDKKYKEFIDDHNYLTRSKQLLNKI